MPARRRSQVSIGVVATVLVVAATAVAAPLVQRALTDVDHARAGSAQSGWWATWRTAPQPPVATGPSHDGFADQTVRTIVHPSIGGRAVRVHVSNAYGDRDLTVGEVTVAPRRSGSIADAHPHPVTFDGKASAVVKPGAELVSDPLPLAVHAGRDLLVSVYLPDATGPATWHRLANTTTYVSGAGNWAAEPGGSPFQTIVPSWFFVDGVDVLTPPSEGTVVAFGDSITDGSYSTLDADATYPDRLAQRATGYAVLNEGIGGNRLLSTAPSDGDPGLQRFQRDALDQPGVTDVVVLEGVNDIGAGATAAQVIDALTELSRRAHAQCVTIIGGTITPFEGSVYDTPEHEQIRQDVNRWIRTSRTFDAVADFDKALRDRADPLQIDPRYHTVGDLHPNDRGYQVMANTVPLGALAARPGCTRD